MSGFSNSPKFDDGMKVKRYSHSPITINHHGIKVSIKENGKVILTGNVKPIPDSNEVEFDELEVPASLIFKIAGLLRDTRNVEFVNVAEVKAIQQ